MIDFIGWTLVHTIWQGGIVAAALAVALWLTRRATAPTRYVLCLVGLALTVTAPIATTFLSRRPVHAYSISPTIRATPPPLASHADASGAAIADRGIVSRSRMSLDRFAAGRVDAILPWLVAVWLFGVTALSIRVLAGIAHVRRLGRLGVSVIEAHAAAADRIAARLGIRSAVRVLQSAHVDVPMVIGWAKPAVIFPVALLAGLPPAQLEMILAHELAHIRRHDTIVNLAQTIVETLLFYHPAIWWISARVREERENCCDDLAIAASGSERGAYGSMLLRLEESRANIALAAAATDGSLLRRIRRIVVGHPSRVDLGVPWFAGVTTMLIVLLVVVPNRAPAASARTEPTITRPPVSAPEARAETTLRQQDPPPTLPVQPPSRSTSMSRPSRSIVAGAAALAIAATNLSAQTPPDFSGRWALVAGSASNSRMLPLMPRDSAAGDLITIEQTERTLTISTASGRDAGRMGFAIEGSDGAGGLRLKGPMSISVKLQGVEISLNATDTMPRLRAEWDKKVFDVSLGSTTAFPPNLGMLTLWLDRDGDLLVQVDIPGVDNQPAKRTFQRFRRA